MALENAINKIKEKLQSTNIQNIHEEKITIDCGDIFDEATDKEAFVESKSAYNSVWKSLGYSSCRFIKNKAELSFHLKPIIDDLDYDDYLKIRANFRPLDQERYSITLDELFSDTSIKEKINSISDFNRIQHILKCIFKDYKYDKRQSNDNTLKFKKDAIEEEKDLEVSCNENEINQIIINRMYAGSFLQEENTIGHESINLINDDNGEYYSYLNSQGTIPVEKTEYKGKKSIMLLVKYYQRGIWEIIGKVQDLHTIEEMIITNQNKSWPRCHRYQLMKDKYTVTYGGKDINDIFAENKYHGKKDRHPFATFKGVLYKPTIPLFIVKDNSISMYEENSVKVLTGLANQSLRMFLSNNYENGNNEAFCDLLELINKEDYWEKSTDTIGNLKSKMVKFNVFNLLGMEKNELAYSNILSHFLSYKDFAKVFIKEGLNLSHEYYEDSYVIAREEHNIDILLKGDKHIIVIENKIKSDINGKGKSREYYINSIFNDSEYKDIDEIKALKEEFKTEDDHGLIISQLAKYYYYSKYIATISEYENGQNIPSDNIKRFILIPNYQESVITRSHIDKEFHGEDYEIKTYDMVLKVCNKRTQYDFKQDRYFNDFKYGLQLQSQKRDNQLENELIDKLKRRIKKYK